MSLSLLFLSFFVQISIPVPNVSAGRFESNSPRSYPNLPPSLRPDIHLSSFGVVERDPSPLPHFLVLGYLVVQFSVELKFAISLSTASPLCKCPLPILTSIYLTSSLMNRCPSGSSFFGICFPSLFGLDTIRISFYPNILVFLPSPLLYDFS